MRLLNVGLGLIFATLSSSVRADFVAEGAFALGSRISTNYNTPNDPPFEFGPTFTMLPPGSLPASLDQRGPGNFADSALKFALSSVVPTGQSIVSATLTLDVTLSLPTPTGRDPALTVSGFTADANPMTLADFSLASTLVAGMTVHNNLGSNAATPIVIDVTSFLQSLGAAGATSAGFLLDNFVGGTIIIAGNDTTNPGDIPTLSITYAATVPEPASLAMVTLGLAVAWGMARRSR